MNNLKVNKNGMVEEKLIECLLIDFGMKLKNKVLKGIIRKEDAMVKASHMGDVMEVTTEIIMIEMILIKKMMRDIILDSAQYLEQFTLLWLSTSFICINIKKPYQMKNFWTKQTPNSIVTLSQETLHQLNISFQI